MSKADDMMILSVEKRRDYFTKVYTLELARLHAKGACMWPADKLPEMVQRVMAGLYAKRAPSGDAFNATLKWFGLKSQKACFAFLGA